VCESNKKNLDSTTRTQGKHKLRVADYANFFKQKLVATTWKKISLLLSREPLLQDGHRTIEHEPND
jgi:hypothetical protein